MTNSESDKTSLAYLSAEAAHSSAIAVRDHKTKEHRSAVHHVTTLQDEKNVLTAWVAYG